jgi:hypothetical protein
MYDQDKKQSISIKMEAEKVDEDEQDVLRKFSDKRFKRIKKEKKEKTKKKNGILIALHRYVLPILFLSPEGKTVLRKCKVLNFREDKKYEHLSKNSWE